MPVSPADAVEEALEYLCNELTLEEVDDSPPSHTLVRGAGLTHDGQVVERLGLYLTALVAGVVQTDATLSTRLLGTTPDASQLLREEIERLIGADNAFDTAAKRDFRDTSRNPWIAEGIGHALLVVRRRQTTACLSGDVAAVSVPHANPKQQGLDLVAIYRDGELPALALGEAKATEAGASSRLSEATAFFTAVERGERDLDIRMHVVALTPALDAVLADNLSYGFWRDRASYLPVIVHGDAASLTNNRPGLAALSRPADAKRVLAFQLAGFHDVFDAVATAMRAAVAEIVPDV